MLLSLLPIPTSSRKIARDWRAGTEILISNRGSGQIYPNDDVSISILTINFEKKNNQKKIILKTGVDLGGARAGADTKHTPGLQMDSNISHLGRRIYFRQSGRLK